MTKLEAMAAWFFTSLGMVLLATSILLVPANAFADAGSECSSTCSTQCGTDTTCYDTCVAQCCSDDPTCCSEACGGDQTCYNACITRCPSQDACALGCSANAGGTGCNPGCSTTGPACLNCECIVTKRASDGTVTQCSCR